MVFAPVPGTYEFEVQPLREYFAARHLYNTAPYSPTGSERPGTLPERFDALARDFYWQNVTRFYAGCYSKGELASLVDRLQELAKSPGYRFTSHPQWLAATLLSDWVFAQDARAMKQVVSIVLNGLGLYCITSGGRRYRRDDPLILPKGSGSDELVERCFELLAATPPIDYRLMLTELIRANSSRDETARRWLAGLGDLKSDGRTIWIKDGLLLGVLSKLNNQELESLLDDRSDFGERLYLYLRSGRTSFIEADEARFGALVTHLLNSNLDVSIRKTGSVIEAFAEALSAQYYSIVHRNRSPISLSELSRRHFYYESEDETTANETPAFPIARDCEKLLKVSHALRKRPAVTWATELSNWNELVETARSLFGDRWAFNLLANSAAGIRSKTDTCDEADDLHNKSISLCRRVRYARLKAGVASWWRLQLENAKSPEQIAFTLLVLITWAGASVFLKHARRIDEKLQSLEIDWWDKLSAAIRVNTFGYGQEKRDLALDVSAMPDCVSERLIVSLDARVNEHDLQQLFQKYLVNYAGNDQSVLEFCQRMALSLAQDQPETWSRWLPIISRSYSRSSSDDWYFGYRLARTIRGQELPSRVAEQVIEACHQYPTELVGLAEESSRQRVAASVTPVGLVAERAGWFKR